MVLKYMDKYWKKAFDEYGGPLLKTLIGEDVISHKPTESVQIDPKTYNRDMVFEKNNHHWIVVEFQHSSLSYDDLTRFALYAYSLSRKYNVFVSLYVICGPGIKNPKCSYKLDENNSFNVNIISMADYDGDKTLNEIQDNLDNLTERNVGDLLLLPLMYSKNSIYIQLIKSIKLVNSIENFDESKLNMIKNAYFILTLKFCENKKQARNLIRMITMKYDGLHDIASQLEQEFFDEGREVGYDEGKTDLINQLIADGVIIENIEKYLNNSSK